jgi:hypothetical protein
MARMTIKAGKSGPKSVPTPGQSGSFVLGSRPASLRAPAVPKVTPLKPNTRDYGKGAEGVSPFGNTSLTSRS